METFYLALRRDAKVVLQAYSTDKNRIKEIRIHQDDVFKYFEEQPDFVLFKSSEKAKEYAITKYLHTHPKDYSDLGFLPFWNKNLQNWKKTSIPEFSPIENSFGQQYPDEQTALKYNFKVAIETLPVTILYTVCIDNDDLSTLPYLPASPSMLVTQKNKHKLTVNIATIEDIATYYTNDYADALNRACIEQKPQFK
ncbi:MAG: hypothetical protein Q8R83_09440 [Legionellaceae bacterium]|nr:hypothetical protein [Legionellaceae bacterium]